ncbi:hypothetical protein BSLG_003360 [Batrachochytrium salamandrivorans]|nr:hypothetical protein BSLG_003360 [Batrachochytrium salamandrivorans]
MNLPDDKQTQGQVSHQQEQPNSPFHLVTHTDAIQTESAIGGPLQAIADDRPLYGDTLNSPSSNPPQELAVSTTALPSQPDTHLGRSPTYAKPLGYETTHEVPKWRIHVAASPETIALVQAIESQTIQANIERDRRGSIGSLNWENQRQAWRRQHIPYDSSRVASKAFKNNASLREVDESHYDSIYESLLNGRRFSKGVPLSFVISILVSPFFFELST